MEETEGLSEGVTDRDTVGVTDTLGEGDNDNDKAVLALTELLDDDETAEEPLPVCETDEDRVCVDDKLLDTLDETDVVELANDDTLTLDDALDEGDVE